MALMSTLHPARSHTDNRSGAKSSAGADLIGRSQAGDVEAFNLLVERYQHRIYGLCVHMLGEADAEDATQEVFLSAFRNMRHYRGGAFGGWLLRIAKNRCYDQLRSRKRRPLISLESDGDGGETLPLQLMDPGEAPDDRLLRAELADELQRRLRELAPDQRLVVVLSDIQGYSHGEIVTATGWPMGTVKSRLSRAHARLRAALRGQLIPDGSEFRGNTTDGPGILDVYHKVG